MFRVGHKRTSVREADGHLETTVISKPISFVERLRFGVGRAVLGIAVLIFAAGAGTWWYVHERDVAGRQNKQARVVQGIPQVSAVEYGKDKAAALRANPPAATASLDEIIGYYQQLIAYQFDAKEYTAATASYGQLMRRVDNVELPTGFVYVMAAQAYGKTGDTKTANTLLDKAVMVDQKVGDVETRDSYLQNIANIRKELK